LKPASPGWEKIQTRSRPAFRRTRAIDFPGADNTFVNRISNEGDIVGFYVMHGDVNGFTLDKGRFLTHDDNAGFSTIISGVNKFDTIVGFYTDTTGVRGHAFRASCKGVF
jgi:hypothetical protein